MDITTAPGTPARSRRIGFRLTVGVPAVLLTLVGGRLLVTGWFATLDAGSHRYHDLSWGVIEGVVILVGLVASLWRPRRWPAAYQQVLVGLAALLLTMGLIRAIDPATLVVGAVLLGGALLHPAREDLLAVGPWHVPSLVVGAVTAAPLLWYAVGQAAVQRSGSMADPHVAMAHYAGTAAAAFALAGIVLLAASRHAGHLVLAGSAVGGLAVLGVASLLWPDLPSSFGVAGGIGALTAAAAVAATSLRRPAA